MTLQNVKPHITCPHTFNHLRIHLSSSQIWSATQTNHHAAQNQKKNTCYLNQIHQYPKNSPTKIVTLASRYFQNHLRPRNLKRDRTQSIWNTWSWWAKNGESLSWQSRRELPKSIHNRKRRTTLIEETFRGSYLTTFFFFRKTWPFKKFGKLFFYSFFHVVCHEHCLQHFKLYQKRVFCYTAQTMDKKNGQNHSQILEHHLQLL